MSIDFDVTVIGAGAVGLAIARNLAIHKKRVLLLESNNNIGQETSSRNSGVIHAGIYYKQHSLKAITCIRGKNLLYEYLSMHKVAHKKIGKYIFANSSNSDRLESLFKNGIENGVKDIQTVDRSHLIKNIPEIKADLAIYSPSSGILDVHGYMQSLLGELQDNGGDVAMLSKFIRATRLKASNLGWKVEVLCGESSKENIAITCEYLINSAGLFAEQVAANIEGISLDKIPKTYFTKGNYFSVSGLCPFKNLIYPLPEKGGLGTHLTLDLGGQALLGPDVEPLSIKWVQLTSNDSFDYSVEEDRKIKFYNGAVKWWPKLRFDQLKPAYSGIRPKINKINEEPADFIIENEEDNNIPGLINLFGIESPGLTASLAIAEIIKSKVL